MTFAEYDQYDAVGLAGLVARGEVTPLELVETAISRIESGNAELNAVIATDFDRALDAARQPVHGLLAGVPYVVKDLHTYVAHLRAASGCRGLSDVISPHDSELVRRMRDGGLIILGKTNAPEFGMNIDTAPSLHGPTRNPHNVAYSAGGSSGGSASAVAAGMVPAAHATDSGGSIRIPASICGLFGFKPSRSRVPLGNDQSEGLGGFSVAHAVTHSTRDSATLLDVTAGRLPGDSYGVATELTPWRARSTYPRVALWTEGFGGEAVHDQCVRAAEAAAELCESIGCEVEARRPPVDGGALREAFDVLFTANIANAVAGVAQMSPDAPLETIVEPATLACAAAASRFSAAAYAAAIQATQRITHDLGTFFDEFDIVLTPTLANPPQQIGFVDAQVTDWQVFLQSMLDEIPFTPLFNATGGPAASLPLATSSDGLPIGVQIASRAGNDATVMHLASLIEAATPWHSRQ